MRSEALLQLDSSASDHRRNIRRLFGRLEGPCTPDVLSFALLALASPFSGLFVRFLFRNGHQRFRQFRESLERQIGIVLAGFLTFPDYAFWALSGKPALAAGLPRKLIEELRE